MEEMATADFLSPLPRRGQVRNLWNHCCSLTFDRVFVYDHFFEGWRHDTDSPNRQKQFTLVWAQGCRRLFFLFSFLINWNERWTLSPRDFFLNQKLTVEGRINSKVMFWEFYGYKPSLKNQSKIWKKKLSPSNNSPNSIIV